MRLPGNEADLPMDDFEVFAALEFKKLGAIPGYAYVPEQRRTQSFLWLLSRAGGDRRKVGLFIRELILECSKLPSIPEMRGIWMGLFPEDRHCPECGGDGFIVVERSGNFGATPCRLCADSVRVLDKPRGAPQLLRASPSLFDDRDDE
jgi:hypothetical protein